MPRRTFASLGRAGAPRRLAEDPDWLKSRQDLIREQISGSTSRLPGAAIRLPALSCRSTCNRCPRASQFRPKAKARRRGVHGADRSEAASGAPGARRFRRHEEAAGDGAAALGRAMRGGKSPPSRRGCAAAVIRSASETLRRAGRIIETSFDLIRRQNQIAVSIDNPDESRSAAQHRPSLRERLVYRRVGSHHHDAAHAVCRTHAIDHRHFDSPMLSCRREASRRTRRGRG